MTPPHAEDAAEAMKELRTLMLTTTASEAGFNPSETFPKVFGVVMDFSISDGLFATVVSMHDGHASLYTTSTFGVVGGIAHESVRNAATQFVAISQSHYDTAAPATEYPYPATDHVRFYLLGFDGVRVVNSEISSVEEGSEKYSGMWTAGQDVLTELRLIAEKE